MLSVKALDLLVLNMSMTMIRLYRIIYYAAYYRGSMFHRKTLTSKIIFSNSIFSILYAIINFTLIHNSY